MDWTTISSLTQLIALQVINCNTRDFACNGFDFNEKETKDFFSDKERGKSKLKNLLLLNKQDKLKTDKYFISLEEILPWLASIKEKTGGENEWRIFYANLDNCHNWDLKYIRFYKVENDKYIVCNSYWIPIEWKQVLENLVYYEY